MSTSHFSQSPFNYAGSRFPSCSHVSTLEYGHMAAHLALRHYQQMLNSRGHFKDQTETAEVFNMH